MSTPIIHLVSFGTNDMHISRKKLIDSFRRHVNNDMGTLSVWTNLYQIEEEFPVFCRQNWDVLHQKRGAGYWLWKPLIIKEALHQAKPGEYVLYCDAGIILLHDLQPLLDLNEDILLFNNEWPHIDWCKMDVMETIIPGWYKPDRPDHQVQASVILIKKTEDTVSFVHEWLKYCQRPGFIDDSPSQLPNAPTFREHRHDQAILTCLQIKYGIPLHWWPAHYQGGVWHKYPSDLYPIMFEHHRKRNPGTNAKDYKGDPQPEWTNEEL